MRGGNQYRWQPFPCFAVVVAHGLTEYTLANFMKRRYHLTMHVLGHNHGRSSIQVSGLSNWISHHSKVRNKRYIDALCGFSTKKQWDGFYIYTIMDVGHVAKKYVKDNYIHGHISPRIKDNAVRSHIKTIYNNPDIEATFKYGGLKNIDRNNKSQSHYRRVFRKQLGSEGQVKCFYNRIKNDPHTNMDIFLKACINHMSNFNRL